MEEELEDQDFLDALEVNDDLMKDMYSKEKRTPPIMWWNEKAGIISKRVKQLNNGKKTTIPEVVESENIYKSYDIAMKEFDLGKLPKYYIKRRLPNGTYELWSHDEFEFYPK
jgi:DNA-directed RNA polymerase subunit K/omega